MSGAAEDDRAEVEVSIQIGMENDEEVLAVVGLEVKKAVRQALRRGAGLVEYVDETQWCSGAMRVTVRRPHIKAVPS